MFEFLPAGRYHRFMAERANGRDTILHDIHVIDGGLATELEYQGARIDGPLWSAHVLEDEPEKLLAVHRAYIASGAQCIATCSYQVSRMGYAEVGLPAGTGRCGAVAISRIGALAAAEFPGPPGAHRGIARSLRGSAA